MTQPNPQHELARSGEHTDIATAVDVARRYYLDDQSKVAIGQQLGISRFQVARLLREARARGIVRIEIRPEGLIDERLGAALAAVLGIGRALVVTSLPGQTTESVVQHLGRALADLLAEEVLEHEVLGLAWSRVCAAMVEQLTTLERCTVVQLAGHLHLPGDTSGSVEAVRLAAGRSGGRAYPIYAPMIVGDAETAQILRKTPEISEALERVHDLDRAVVSIGAWGTRHSRVYQRLSAEVRQRGADLGVCGEISGRLFDASGRHVPALIDDRVIGITLDQLGRVPERIATSWGADAAGAVRTACRAGWVTTLIVDEQLARALLGGDEQRPV